MFSFKVSYSLNKSLERQCIHCQGSILKFFKSRLMDSKMVFITRQRALFASHKKISTKFQKSFQTICLLFQDGRGDSDVRKTYKGQCEIISPFFEQDLETYSIQKCIW